MFRIFRHGGDNLAAVKAAAEMLGMNGSKPRSDQPSEDPKHDGSKGEEGPGAVLICLSDIVRKPINWLWPGRIAFGKLCLFYGDPGKGKSTLTICLMAIASIGGAWPDGAGYCAGVQVDPSRIRG